MKALQLFLLAVLTVVATGLETSQGRANDSKEGLGIVHYQPEQVHLAFGGECILGYKSLYKLVF